MKNILTLGLFTAVVLWGSCNVKKTTEKECLGKIYSSLSDAYRTRTLSDTLTYGYLIAEPLDQRKSKDTLWASRFELYSHQLGWRSFDFKKDFFIQRACCGGKPVCLLPVVIIQSDKQVTYPKALDDMPELFQTSVVAAKKDSKAHLREPLIYQRYWNPVPVDSTRNSP